jgi:hypothetical protein
MRVTSYNVARPATYDRGSVSTFGSYDELVGPHATTTRFSSTVAAGRKMLIEAVSIESVIFSAATVAGRRVMFVRIQSGTTVMDIGRIDSPVSLTVGNYVADIRFGAVTVYEGEIVLGKTLDESTGGSISMTLAFKGTTFDA